jgi:hypothetical protein
MPACLSKGTNIMPHSTRRKSLAVALLIPLAAVAQTKGPQQVVRPPIAQAWIDVATFAGMGGMGTGMSGNPMGAFGGMMGGGRNEGNRFGNTQMGSAGQWVDVTLRTSRNPDLQDATQAVPAGSKLAPMLNLLSPKEQKAPPADDETPTPPENFERPKGRIYLYWGCSETLRPGQPRVLDMATAAPMEYGSIFQSRHATQRGTHAARGRPLWPNPNDTRMVPDGASLVGEHAFAGQGVPDNFRFAIPAAQDIMPPFELNQRNADGATLIDWKTMPTARAYFLAAMGSRGRDEIVFWSSSELPEAGMGLNDYQTNSAVDRWLKEKVLLAPGETHCAVPKGAFSGEGAILRAIAYGSELNLAYPPRPADPKKPWEPEWAAKIRVKSVTSAMLGMNMDSTTGRRGRRDVTREAPREEESREEARKEAPRKEEQQTIKPVDVLRGIFGR